MTPYHINCSFRKCWLDLESILVIHDPLCYEEKFFSYTGISPSGFVIELMFKDSPVLIQTHTIAKEIFHSDFKNAAEFDVALAERNVLVNKIYAEREEILKVHRELVQAWMNLK